MTEIKLQFHVKWMTWWMELQFNLVVDMSVFLAYPFLKMMDDLPINIYYQQCLGIPHYLLNFNY